MSVDPTAVKLGDEFWVADHSTHDPVRVPCPVCAGKLRITVILGDGTELHPECDYCSKGEIRPLGYITEHRDTASAKRARITEIHAKDDGTFEFYSRASEGHSYIYQADMLCTDRDEALAVAEQKCAEQRERIDEHNVRVRNKSSIRRYGWNVGYYLRTAKRNREEAERYEAKAGLEATP